MSSAKMAVKQRSNQLNFLKVIFFLVFVCFVLVGFFSQPSSDDWSYSNMQGTVLQSTIQMYQTWCARYTGVAIGLAFLKNVKYYRYYWAFNIPLILLIFFSFRFFLSQAGRVVRVPWRKDQLALTTYLMMSAFLLAMPSIEQSIYWIVGAIMYGVPQVLLFLYLGILLLKAKNIFQEIILSLAALLSGFLMVGTNEPAAIIYTAMSLLLLIYVLIKKVPVNYILRIGSGLITSVIGSLLVLLAPGNSTRVGYANPEDRLFDPIFSLLLAVKGVIAFIVKRFFLYPPLLIFVLIFLFFLFKKIIVENKYKIPAFWKDLWPATTAGLFALFSIFVTEFFAGYATGMRVPPRTLAVPFGISIVASLIVIFNLACFSLHKKTVLAQIDLNLKRLGYLLGFIGLIVLGTFAWHVPQYFQYYQENQQRYDQIEKYSLTQRKNLDFVFVPLSVTPWPIYNRELWPEPNRWPNFTMANYFKIKSVCVKTIK